MDFMILNRPFLPTNSFSSVVLASIFAVGATFTVGKLFAAFLRRTDESTLGRAVVEAVILLTASRGDASHVLRDAAKFYKVDVAAITTTVKQEFAAKEKTKAAKTATPKPAVKAPTKTAKRVAA